MTFISTTIILYLHQKLFNSLKENVFVFISTINVNGAGLRSTLLVCIPYIWTLICIEIKVALGVSPGFFSF